MNYKKFRSIHRYIDTLDFNVVRSPLINCKQRFYKQNG